MTTATPAGTPASQPAAARRPQEPGTGPRDGGPATSTALAPTSRRRSRGESDSAVSEAAGEDASGLGQPSTLRVSGGRRRSVRARQVLVALGMVIATTFGFAAVASPASAATSVTYCFVLSNGTPLSSETTSLYAWTTDRGWVLVTYGRTGSNGCGSFDTSWLSNFHVKVTAGSFTSRLRGETPYYSHVGSGNSHLGTGVAWFKWY